jgi:hypothetical protein
MLTRDDRTIPDPLAVCRQLAGLGLEHVGVKDVGLVQSDLPAVVTAVHDLGAEASVELVGLDRAGEARWAGVAVDAGVDLVLGGAHPEVIARVLNGAPVRYFPFAGDVTGHPTRLYGAVSDIVTSARRLADLGVDGLDLLAYRFPGDAVELAEAVCAAAPLPVLAAGGIHSEEQILALARAGVWGFTMGTAMLDGTFRRDAESLRRRVTFALHAARRAAAALPT